jgi:hypothetical protein
LWILITFPPLQRRFSTGKFNLFLNAQLGIQLCFEDMSRVHAFVKET